MDIKEFMEVDKLEQILEKFSAATGLAVTAVDNKGDELAASSNVSDSCRKTMRSVTLDKQNSITCEDDFTGSYKCYINSDSFSVDIVVAGEKTGSVIACLPSGGDLSAELKDKLDVFAELFGLTVNQLVNCKHSHHYSSSKSNDLSEEIKHATEIIDTINNNTRSLKSIANKQKMLSLNASIEAARSGEAGVGFAVVAKSMGDLSSQSATIYSDIEKSVIEVTDSIEKLSALFNEK